MVDAEVARGVGDTVRLIVGHVAAKVSHMVGLDLSVLHDQGDDGGKLSGEEAESDADDASDTMDEMDEDEGGRGEEEDVYEEESEGQLRAACIREMRASTQLGCEVYVEYCTAARTSGFVPDPLDRAQVDGLTLQGSLEAYEQRYQALRKELVHSGLFPPDRIRVQANFDCFHLLEAAARSCSTAQQCIGPEQAQASPAAVQSSVQSSVLAPQLPKPAGARAAGSGGASQNASAHEMTGGGASRNASGASHTGLWARGTGPAGQAAQHKRAMPVPYKARSASWGAGTRTLIGNFEATGVGHAFPARHFPRIGSFEVYVRGGRGRAVEQVYSKLLLGKFKPMALVAQDICRAVVRAVAATELSVWLVSLPLPPTAPPAPWPCAYACPCLRGGCRAQGRPHHARGAGRWRVATLDAHTCVRHGARARQRSGQGAGDATGAASVPAASPPAA